MKMKKYLKILLFKMYMIAVKDPVVGQTVQVKGSVWQQDTMSTILDTGQKAVNTGVM
jgi:hypothetical protein